MMRENVFLDDKKPYQLEDYMNYSQSSRGNLGEMLPVQVYRLLEYSIRDQILKKYGREEQIQIFRDAGYEAGVYFAKNWLDLSLEMNEFLAALQTQLEELKIGVLRIERIDPETQSMVLTVSEDADCSGLPLLGETVCNYDEGFLAGVLTSYTGKAYQVEEIDCWATGDRVCRFRADKKQIKNNRI